jgi:16S rRNA processing protein RimM
VLLTLDGINTRTQAEQLRNVLVQVPITEAISLPDDGVYLYQLMGLSVVTTDQKMLGTITDILETKANDVYVVATPDKKELLLPAIPDVIKQIDLEHKQVVVHLIDGLM